jgi:hypothetical protein
MATKSITCNLNCICVNPDCSFGHCISYKERKNFLKIYNATPNKMFDEPNMELRKKNCTFGQLCEKESCGYKHRLSFPNREKIIIAYKFNKICPDNSTTSKKTTIIPKANDFKTHNSFSALDEIPVEEVEVEQQKPVIIIENTNKNSWASIVKNEKKKVAIARDENNVPLNWEDCADEDFFMEFK